MDIIKYQAQKDVAHAQRAPHLFGLELFITVTYLHVFTDTFADDF